MLYMCEISLTKMQTHSPLSDDQDTSKSYRLLTARCTSLLGQMSLDSMAAVKYGTVASCLQESIKGNELVSAYLEAGLRQDCGAFQIQTI